MVLRCVAMKDMSWLCRSPTAIALFHRFTMLCDLRIRSTPSPVMAVSSTSAHGALKRHKSPLRPPLPSEYLTQVGLWVWICVAPAQKFASSSNEAENCPLSASNCDISDVTDRSAWIAQKPSWSRSCLIRQLSRLSLTEGRTSTRRLASLYIPRKRHCRRI
jgi:hypothetical protein